jgi:hypothetical protein
MALNDNAVLVAALGYVYTGPVGLAMPTPSQVESFDFTQFGAQVNSLTLTGAPTGGTFTVTVAAQTTATIAYNATPAAVQAAIEALSTVGVGNTVVTGTSLTTGLTIAFAGSVMGQTLVVTATGTALTGGTTPAAVVALVTAANGWNMVGHTARNDLPEFAFDGGKTELRGSWQKQRLREVEQGAPIEDMLKVTLEQWDKNTLPLYFGQNVSTTTGVYAADGLHTPQNYGLYVHIVDGTNHLGFYAPKAAIVRDAAIKLPIDDFAQLPIKATFLNYGIQPLFQWISLDLLS